jgi:hypothetical protein
MRTINSKSSLERQTHAMRIMSSFSLNKSEGISNNELLRKVQKCITIILLGMVQQFITIILYSFMCQLIANKHCKEHLSKLVTRFRKCVTD